LARRLPFTDGDVLHMLRFVARRGERHPGSYWLTVPPVPRIVGQAERYLAANGMAEEMRSLLQRCRVSRDTHVGGVEGNRMAARIEAMLGEAPQVFLTTSELWAERAYRDLMEMDEAVRAPWMALLSPLRQDAAKPSQAWLDESRRMVDSIGADGFS